MLNHTHIVHYIHDFVQVMLERLAFLWKRYSLTKMIWAHLIL